MWPTQQTGLEEECIAGVGPLHDLSLVIHLVGYVRSESYFILIPLYNKLPIIWAGWEIYFPG